MRKKSILTGVFFLILSMISYGREEVGRVLRQGSSLRAWLSDETLDNVYRYLDGAGINVDKLMRNPYFLVEEGGEFFLEIEGSFNDLNLRSSGFIEDRFYIEGTSYQVKFRPNYNEIAMVYSEDRMYLSNRLERVYMGIEGIDELKRELTGYFKPRSDFSTREIRYEDEGTIYGRSFLKSYEKRDEGESTRLFYKSFSIDEEVRKNQDLGRIRLLMSYQDLAKALMRSTPEVGLSPERLKGLLDGRTEGVFSSDEAVAIKFGGKTSEKSIVELYNEGVLKRIGLETGVEEEVYYMDFPFYDERKYIYAADTWVFISGDLEYIRKLKGRYEIEKTNFLDRLNTLLDFKEEDSGYIGHKEGA